MDQLEARRILEMALDGCASDDVVLTISGSAVASTRFANNAITQNVSKADCRITIQAAFGQQVGAAQTNDLSPESIREAVARAEEIATHAATDNEHMPPIEPTAVPDVQSWDAAVADASPETRAAGIRDAVELARQHGLNSAGSFTTGSDFTAILNTRGHFAYHQRSNARFACTVMTADSSGWAANASHVLGRVNPHNVAEKAVTRALAARNPKAIDARPRTVLLEPAAFGELLAYLAWSLDAKAADEGRSPFTNRLGTRVAVPGLHLSSAPSDPVCPGEPFDGEGVPSPDVSWIEDGILRNLAHTRYWASHYGRAYTGRPTNLLVAGSDRSIEDMISETEDAILVTRFWYIRHVDPMTLLLTGMTRDGLYQVKDGRIVHGVKHMRFNESPIRLLDHITAIGRSEPAYGYARAFVPPVRADDFHFTSGTVF